MKNPISKSVTLLLMVLIVCCVFIFFPNNILSWDIFGYYLYLPLKFIYNDLGLENETLISEIIEKYHNTATFYQAIKIPEGTYVMKYPMGQSFFYAPFFFIGHLIAKISSYPADGFSLPYQYSIIFGSIIYTLIGVLFLRKILIQFFNDITTTLVMFIIVVGTNYLIHNSMHGQNAMSHNYLFTTYTLIIWLTILWYKYYKLKHVIFLGLVCGITILIRPSEVVCLIIPLLWGVKNKDTFIGRFNLFLKFKTHIILFILILLIFGSFQFIYWKIYAGKFLFYSYGGNPGEGFEFFSPYIFKVLFSFRKGWLIYTPVMMFALIGFISLYSKNRAIFYAIFLYFIFNLYLVSSWSCWWYAQSFGQRALIPSYVVLAIPIGYFINWLNKLKQYIKVIILGFIALLVLFNIFQTRQFLKGVIHGDRMTKDYYFAVFGKNSVSQEDEKLLLVKRSFTVDESFDNENEYNKRLLQTMDFEDTEANISDTAYTGKSSFRLDSVTEYSPAIDIRFSDITSSDHAWIRASAYVFPIADTKTSPFSFIIHFKHRGYIYKYRSFDSENMDLELNKWNFISYDYLTPEVRKKSNSLMVFFWNRGKKNLYVDDLRVEVFEPER